MPVDLMRRYGARLSAQLLRLRSAHAALGPTQRRRRNILLVLSFASVFGAVAAFGVAPLAPDAALMPSHDVTVELATPALEQQMMALESDTGAYTHEERIRRGDTLGTLLTRLSVSDPAAEQFIRADPNARGLYQLRPGRLIEARTNASGSLVWMRYVNNAATDNAADSADVSRGLVVERVGDGFRASQQPFQNERRLELRTGEITSSLFGATDAAGIPDGIATQIPEIFSGDIDFYRDLHRGDRFRVIYEMYYQDGEVARPGRVLAVEFNTAGKMHQAVWYHPPGSDGGYYGPEGQSLHRAFLRTPLQFTRISSGFGGRLHPILNTWRQHTGVDYAAPIGTPVRSTADGVVASVGVQNGYGNAIMIQHQGVYATLYGHLSAFAAGLRKGQRVSQGQLIGYVGMTGWATGPHLHYEFRIAGVPKDPLKVVLPDAVPIAHEQLASFRVNTQEFQRDLAMLRDIDGSTPRLAIAVAAIN